MRTQNPETSGDSENSPTGPCALLGPSMVKSGSCREVGWAFLVSAASVPRQMDMLRHSMGVWNRISARFRRGVQPADKISILPLLGLSKSAIIQGAFYNGGENLNRPYRARGRVDFCGGNSPAAKINEKGIFYMTNSLLFPCSLYFTTILISLRPATITLSTCCPSI